MCEISCCCNIYRYVYDLDSRSESLKRKHVSSVVEPGAEADNASQPNSSAAAYKEDSLPSFIFHKFWSDEETHSQKALGETRFPTSGCESPHSDGFRASELNCTSISGDAFFESFPSAMISESELNQNVLPVSRVWVPAFPSVSLAGLDDGLPCQDRMTSLGSSSEFGDADDLHVYTTVTHLNANVLVVSHGGFISQLIGHFADEHDCRLPGGARIAYTVTPNAGLSRFLVSISPRSDGDDAGNRNDPDPLVVGNGKMLVRIQCIVLHDKDHLANDVDVEALPTSEPV